MSSPPILKSFRVREQRLAQQFRRCPPKVWKQRNMYPSLHKLRHASEKVLLPKLRWTRPPQTAHVVEQWLLTISSYCSANRCGPIRQLHSTKWHHLEAALDLKFARQHKLHFLLSRSRLHSRNSQFSLNSFESLLEIFHEGYSPLARHQMMSTLSAVQLSAFDQFF